MLKGKHVIRVGNRVIDIGDPATIGTLCLLGLYATDLQCTTTTGNKQTVSLTKPDVKIVLANGDVPPASTSDYKYYGNVVFQATAQASLDTTLKFTVQFTPTQQIIFNEVSLVADFGGFEILLYRGVTAAPVTVNANESIAVEIEYSVA